MGLGLLKISADRNPTKVDQEATRNARGVQMSRTKDEFIRQQELKDLLPPDPDDIDWEYEKWRDNLLDAIWASGEMEIFLYEDR
jgi:hypothetical protein